MAVKLFLCLGLAVLLVLSSSPRVSVADSHCAIVGPYPGKLEGTFPQKGVQRFDLLSTSGKLLGRQIVFNGSSDANVLMSPEAKLINGNKEPRVKCIIDNGVVLKSQTHVDDGPQIILHSVYLGRASVAVSFYAYRQDFLAGRKDEGVINQLFTVRLDGRSPYEVQVTAKPGQNVTVRFDKVAAGTHRLQFDEMEMGGPQMRYYSTGLYELDFTQPEVLSAR